MLLDEKLINCLNPDNESDQLIFLRLQYENQKKKEYDFEKSKNEARNALMELEKVIFYKMNSNNIINYY